MSRRVVFHLLQYRNVPGAQLVIEDIQLLNTTTIPDPTAVITLRKGTGDTFVEIAPGRDTSEHSIFIPKQYQLHRVRQGVKSTIVELTLAVLSDQMQALKLAYALMYEHGNFTRDPQSQRQILDAIHQIDPGFVHGKEVTRG